MVSSQLHYTKVNRFMPFLLAELLNFQGSIHRIGVGSFRKTVSRCMCEALEKLVQEEVAQKAKETAKALNKEGMPVEKIAQVLGEDEETVRNWLTHE